MIDLDREQPGSALLDQGFGGDIDEAGFQRRVRRAERRMASECDLTTGREDADAIIRRRLGRMQEEGGLDQIRPGCEGLKVSAMPVIGTEHDAERISTAGSIGEYVELQEAQVAECVSVQSRMLKPGFSSSVPSSLSTANFLRSESNTIGIDGLNGGRRINFNSQP